MAGTNMNHPHMVYESERLTRFPPLHGAPRLTKTWTKKCVQQNPTEKNSPLRCIKIGDSPAKIISYRGSVADLLQLALNLPACDAKDPSVVSMVASIRSHDLISDLDDDRVVLL